MWCNIFVINVQGVYAEVGLDMVIRPKIGNFLLTEVLFNWT